MAVFIPLLFMGGLVGRLFHEFAVTVCLAIFVSGIISLTLTPMLCSRFLRAEADLPPPNAFGRACEKAFQWLLGHYEAGLKWVLRHHAFTLGVALLTMVATVWLYTVVPKGFFPQQDTGGLMGTTEASQDISFAAMAQLQKKVSAIVLGDPAVATIGSFIGAAAGSTTINNGRMFITLKPRGQRNASADQVINRLRKKMSQRRRHQFVSQAESGHPRRRTVEQSAVPIRAAIRRTSTTSANGRPGSSTSCANRHSSRDVTSDQQMLGLQMNVVVDRDAASRLGVSLVRD